MKGIKCTSNEVNAILAGDKGQIRLVIKHQPNPKCTLKSRRNRAGNIRWMEWHTNTDGKSRFSGIGLGNWKCPLGEIGDLVFVKETFIQSYLFDCDKDKRYENEIYYPATDASKYWKEYKNDINYEKFSPPQHMKQHQSRITLRIKDISVERLCDISDSDCWAEGICDKNFSFSELSSTSKATTLQSGFRDMWNATHKKPEEKWEANPWIWRIEFEVVK